MANITMFDVKEKRIHNEKIREMMGNCYTIHQTMEIRRLRWLEKLSAMPVTRNPRKIFISWITSTTNRKTVPNNQQSICAHCRRGTQT
eukprot:scaffold6433_cov125-Cylindrotheca_fusiformis.AAC.1